MASVRPPFSRIPGIEKAGKLFQFPAFSIKHFLYQYFVYLAALKSIISNVITTMEIKAILTMLHMRRFLSVFSESWELIRDSCSAIAFLSLTLSLLSMVSPKSTLTGVSSISDRLIRSWASGTERPVSLN